MERESWLTRRSLLKGMAAVAGTIGLARLSTALEPTPEIPDDDEPTPSQTEGPFYKPKTPQRKSLREGVKGEPLVVEGQVLSTKGTPIAGALLDFWHCDAEGDYDNGGFRCRGHQYADKNGRYKLETILPGLYPGRTRHIHVRVQAPQGKILTTQLYFPGEERNRTDGIFDRRLEMKVGEKEKTKQGTFNFVLRP